MNSHADVQYKPACPFCRGQGAANEVTMHKTTSGPSRTSVAPA